MLVVHNLNKLPLIISKYRRHRKCSVNSKEMPMMSCDWQCFIRDWFYLPHNSPWPSHICSLIRKALCLVQRKCDQVALVMGRRLTKQCTDLAFANVCYIRSSDGNTPYCSWDWITVNIFVYHFWTPTQQSIWQQNSSRNPQLLLVTPQRAAVSSVSVNKQFAMWTAEASCVNKTGFELWHAAVSMKAEEGSTWLRPRACGYEGSNGSSPALVVDGKHLLPSLSPWNIPLGKRPLMLSIQTRSFLIRLWR